MHCNGTKGLFTNYGEGGLQNRKGEACEVLAMLKGGGHNKSWGSFYTVALSYSHIEVGSAKSFHSLKRGGGAKRFNLL